MNKRNRDYNSLFDRNDKKVDTKKCSCSWEWAFMSMKNDKTTHVSCNMCGEIYYYDANPKLAYFERLWKNSGCICCQKDINISFGREGIKTNQKIRCSFCFKVWSFVKIICNDHTQTIINKLFENNGFPKDDVITCNHCMKKFRYRENRKSQL